MKFEFEVMWKREGKYFDLKWYFVCFFVEISAHLRKFKLSDDIIVKIEKNFEDIGSFLMKERWNEKKKQYDLFLFQIFSTIGRNYIELTKLAGRDDTRMHIRYLNSTEQVNLDIPTDRERTVLTSPVLSSLDCSSSVCVCAGSLASISNSCHWRLKTTT